MSRLPDIKRLVKEDFPSDQQQMIEKIGFVINIFMEQVVRVLNKNIDFDNLNQEIKDITVSVDGTGKPIQVLQIKTSLSKPKGIICIKADNSTNSTIYPTGAVQLNYTLNGDIITVNNITGLQASQKYALKILIIG